MDAAHKITKLAMLLGVVRLKIFVFHVDLLAIKLGYPTDLKIIVLQDLVNVQTIQVDAVGLLLV